MKRILRTLLFLLLPVALLAHDTWLIPSAFESKPGETVRLRLATSMSFPSSDGADAPDRVARFTLRTPGCTAGFQPAYSGSAAVPPASSRRFLVLLMYRRLPAGVFWFC